MAAVALVERTLSRRQEYFLWLGLSQTLCTMTKVASAAMQGHYLPLAQQVEMTEDYLIASSCPGLCWQGNTRVSLFQALPGSSFFTRSL